MPQMNPMNWIMLFLYFNLLMMIVMSMLYFNYTSINQSINYQKTNKLMNNILMK
uniref:ATP synthase F0 subunit 8 n=1 Tax=Drepanocentron fuxiensis TaxID=3058442 RepID=UPI0026E18B35|nr:ATP synthase F0 subunit 8 [Drepanocentron fuxiensis]WJW73310.1 ATP synthase F0 subunit 8 [Drepanocentron fuxiensis]